MAYADVLAATGPDFVHPCADGFVFGARGYAYRYDNTKNTTHVAGSYSTAQPRGILDVSTREELTPTSQYTLTPWPLSQAASGGLIATCHAVW